MQSRPAFRAGHSRSTLFRQPSLSQLKLLEKPPIAPALEILLGGALSIGIDAYDGSRTGPPYARARVILRSPAALHHILRAPGELGFARAYAAGELDFEGDIYEIAREAERLRRLRIDPRALWTLLRAGGLDVWRRVALPPEEARLTGKRHSKERDAAAVAYHYDVSNDFYRIVLGPSMTYSCAVFRSDDETLEQAQENKLDLVCRKLGLRPGMRLLDVGCGWGSLVVHAVRRYGVDAVGVTLSEQQAAHADATVREAGLEDRVEIRLGDYREIADGPYDAISSIGMFEHVGLVRLDEYLRHLLALLHPGARLLNHGISRGSAYGSNGGRRGRGGFIDRYVFPDSELYEIGSVISAMQRAGFEVCDVEGLRDHYSRTLAHWLRNLEDGWESAVEYVGRRRARVWRLYMASCAIGFETNRTGIHQVLAVRPTGDRTGLPLRPDWELPSPTSS